VDGPKKREVTRSKGGVRGSGKKARNKTTSQKEWETRERPCKEQEKNRGGFCAGALMNYRDPMERKICLAFFHVRRRECEKKSEL